MPKYSVNLATAWLVLSACVVAARGSAGGLGIRVWDVNEGLPQSSVTAVTQTRDGYLWVGTVFNGLARFDGTRFTRFNEANTPGLASGRIVRLFEDSSANLWIGTETAGVFLVRDGRVISLDIGRGSREGRLMSICEDTNRAVWLYTADGQLCRYQSNRVDVWNAGAGRASSTRTVITEASGITWVGTDWTLTGIGPVPEGPAVALPVVHEFQFPAINKLDSLLASRSGGFWRLANGRIQKWNSNQIERDLGVYPWTNSIPVSTVCEDLEGNLVVGTYGSGIYLFDAQGQATRLAAAELHHDFILSVALDREGCLWVGTDGGGLARIKRQQFHTVESSVGSTVQSVCPDKEGGLWIGYNWDRVEYLREGTIRSYTNLLGEPDFRNERSRLYVRSVYVDAAQRVWAGTYLGGLLQFRSGQFRPTAASLLLPRDSEFSVFHQDRQGRLWVGTQNGLAVMENSTWRVVTNGLSSTVVRAIAEDDEGNLWIGTQGGGLNRMGEDGVTIFGKTNGLPSENVSALLVDQQGDFWVGTASGLAVRRQEEFFSLAGRLGTPADGIAYLLEDEVGSLWIGLTAGLARVAAKDLKDLASGITSRIQTRTYGITDGMPSMECSQGSQPAACRTTDGKLWFPTIRGLVSIDPALVTRNTNPPPVLIEAVLVDNEIQGTNGLRAAVPAVLTLKPGQQALEIQYTSLNLAAPDKCRFRYRLDPHETGWTEVEADRRFARYTRVPPGEYRFEVTACNEDGVWNEAGQALSIVVLPPFYRTWWFMAISGLLLLGAVIGSVHYVSTQRLQRQLIVLRQQEALEKERARIARDLHDQLGANLTQVALLSEMTETDAEIPEEVQNHARQIGQTAIETTRALDEIVWTVNPSNDTLDGLVNYLCKYAQDYLAIAGLRYRLEVPPELPNVGITPELRHNVFLAAREAVNNVVKHSQASTAWIRLRLASGQFSLEIEDNGRGLAPGDENKGRNGLKNMLRRMEDIGGRFEAGPGAEGGTRIRLTAPLPKLAGTH